MGRGFNWGAFLAGTAAGMNMGTKYRELKKQDALEADLGQIGENQQTTQGAGLKITDKDGNTSTAVVDPSAGGNIDEAVKQYEDAGYKVERVETPRFVNRQGSVDTGTFDTKDQADAARVAGNYDRMGKIADVYDKHGKSDKAMDIRKAVRDGINQELQTKLSLSREKRDQETHDASMEDRNAKKDAAKRTRLVGEATSKAYEEQAAAREGLGDQQRFTGDMARLVQGAGLEQRIKEAAGPKATKDEIQAAIEQYRKALGDAEYQKRNAQQETLYGRMAEIYGMIGQDPAKAEEFKKMADAEGLMKTIAMVKEGNLDEANKIFNGSGEVRGYIVSTGKRKSTGDDLVAQVVNPYTGAIQHINVSETERNMMGMMDKAKLEETKSKTEENRAQAGAASASAEASRASAEKYRAEAEAEKTGGGKAGERAANLRKEYQGYAKNALGITDTMMTKIDAKEAARREKIYNRYMAELESVINSGGMPNHNAIMEKAKRQGEMDKVTAPKGEKKAPSGKDYKGLW
jgi:hypothetical protein